MKVNVSFTDAQIKSILKNNLVILVDSREQKNQHILSYLDKKKIKYELTKLDYGDYSCKFVDLETYGITYPISLEKNCVVERKNSLEEVSGNLTQGRTQFENEFIRAKGDNCNVHLVIADGSFDKVAYSQYNTEFNNKSFYNSLLSFQIKYGLSIEFVSEKIFPLHLLNVLTIEARNHLK